MWESGGELYFHIANSANLGRSTGGQFQCHKRACKKIRHYIQNKRASVETSTLKVEVHIPFGRFMGTALPLNVLVGAVVEDLEELVLVTGTGVMVEATVAVLRTVDELTWAQ
jgi:hypothetical protein